MSSPRPSRKTTSARRAADDRACASPTECRPFASALGQRRRRSSGSRPLWACIALCCAVGCSSDDPPESDRDAASRADASESGQAALPDVRRDVSADTREAVTEPPADGTGSSGSDATMEPDGGARVEGGAPDTDGDAPSVPDASIEDSPEVDAGDASVAPASDSGDAPEAAPPRADAAYDSADPVADADAAAGLSDVDTAFVEASPPPGLRDLVVVAHPDDDILFFNPDIADAIRAGVAVRTVYLTSGDSMMQDWNQRERGVLAALSTVANPSGAWACQPGSYAGHQVRSCTLAGAPRVTAIFMRILDGSLGALWQLAPNDPFPAVNPVAAVATVDGSSTYTRAELAAAVLAIVHEFAPARVLSMDSTLAYGHDDEHHDHVAVGMFALAAAQADGNVAGLRIYRNYTGLFLPGNMTPAQYDEKAALMTIYGSPLDANDEDDSATRYAQRQYSFGAVTGGAATLQRGQGNCLCA